MTTVYKNDHFPLTDYFKAMFTVKDAPQEMIDNIGRKCWLKMVSGMSNPYGVNHEGTLLAPMWTENSANPTDQPRVCEIVGLQYDFRGDVCYRIHYKISENKINTFGRCARASEIILI